jgi:hypothetical protein
MSKPPALPEAHDYWTYRLFPGVSLRLFENPDVRRFTEELLC